MTTAEHNRAKARSAALHQAKGQPWPCVECYPEDGLLAHLDTIDARLDRVEAILDGAGLGAR